MTGGSHPVARGSGPGENASAWPHGPVDLLPGAMVFASRDLYEARDYFSRTYCPHNLQLTRRGEGLDAWLNHRRLGKLGIGVMAYGADVAIEGIEDEDMLLLMHPLSGMAEIGTARGTVNSDARYASVVDTGELRRMRWSADCVQRVVQIGNAVLDHHAMMLMGRPLSQKLRFAPEMPVAPDLVNCWHYASLLGMELSVPGGGANRAVLDSLETLFVLKLLESHPNNYSEQLKPQPCKIAPHHVRRVEQFIIAHADQAITLEQLVEVGGVSARALFDGFRRFRGTSPMAFLKSVRLERARDDLRNAAPGESVTVIACRWGFYQFGRFAAQYKRMFGELPSETLRQLN
ncbi:AraC family transcriptional regulator [Novosphingobium album (ex Liu et al. 2023)]|uniref:AraC family transcriptional regulator n=1 Tax=Novosphingobium album (ex Liu et al. 2023) TaxID=3031130 RepID=A0ABT5WSP1_9SPHN|nr:AraC family transcriptional regulator [Novosphingobium album (ex Liu et al. 2023)]MDE8652018.1 AraC family transcriptional regulator [Novosphingobium album (ex Liu et al. 2023)]